MSGNVHPSWERIVAGCVGRTITDAKVYGDGAVEIRLDNGHLLAIIAQGLTIAASVTLAAAGVTEDRQT